jgi:HlyD family secretion protein
MNKSLKWTLWVAGALAILLLFFKMKGGGSNTEKVATEKVSKRTIIESVSTSGKIYPENEIKIIPEFSGKVEDLKVAEGDSVKKGQLLARVGNRSSLTAPINGIILSLKVKEGENVTGNSFNTGTEIMTVADMSVLEVRTDVGENDVVKIHKGDSANVEVDAYSNRKFKGVVVSIANSVKAVGLMASQNDITSYEVRIRLIPESYADITGSSFVFRPGMNARAEIKTQRKDNVLSVPIITVNARTREAEKSLEEVKKEADKKEETASGNDELEEVVFVLQKDGTVKKVTVESGIQDIDYIEIKKGLIEGDEVITAPYSAISQKLKSGMKVKVVTKDKLFEK